MNNLNVLKGTTAVLSLLVVALGAAYVLHPNCPADGNPVGFDLTSQPQSNVAPTLTGTVTCLAQRTCKYVEIHYLSLPAPNSPPPGNGAVYCTEGPGQQRKLPTCPSGAECLTLHDDPGNTPMRNQMQDKDRSRGWHPWESAASQVELIFSQSPPSAR